MSSLVTLRETPWETRNLGVPSYALVQDFWVAPDFDLLASELRALFAGHGRLFAAARLPKERLPMIPALQVLGFYVVECSLAPTMALAKNPVLRDFERDPAAFVPVRFAREDLEFSAGTVMNPQLAETLKAMAQSAFSGDRFHVDHQCPPAIADRRFAFWMDDLLADPGVRFDVLRLKGEAIAFFASKGNHQIVSGFSPERAASGLGEFFWLSVCAAAKAEGQTFVHSLISCNNLPSVNLCARCGYRFKETGYTLHRWDNPPR
jgi:hypothetical protein